MALLLPEKELVDAICERGLAEVRSGIYRGGAWRMSALIVEVLTPTKEWVAAGQLRPGDPQGSISDNDPDGGERSVIKRGTRDTIAIGRDIRVVAGKDMEIVAELSAAQPTFTTEVRTDLVTERRVVRWRHVG